MTATRFSLCLAALALTTSSATAGDFPPGFRLAQIAKWIDDARENYAAGAKTQVALTECKAAVAAARSAKMTVIPDSNKILEKYGATRNKSTHDWEISVEDAEKRLCGAHARMLTLLKHYGTFADAAEYTRTLSNSPTPAEGKFAIEKSAECFAAVTALADANIPATEPYIVETAVGKVVAKTVGELTNVCEAFKQKGQVALDEIAAAKAAYEERLKKAGITGDKAEWFKHYDGQLFLKGGSAPSDLTKYAAATVWFAYSYTPDPDINGNHSYELRRYQFSGAKLTKSTTKTFKKPLGFRTTIGTQMK